jgi:hypothetical protein
MFLAKPECIRSGSSITECGMLNLGLVSQVYEASLNGCYLLRLLALVFRTSLESAYCTYCIRAEDHAHTLRLILISSLATFDRYFDETRDHGANPRHALHFHDCITRTGRVDVVESRQLHKFTTKASHHSQSNLSSSLSSALTTHGQA